MTTLPPASLLDLVVLFSHKIFYVRVIASIGKTKDIITILVMDWVPLWVMRVQMVPGSEELS